MRCQQFFSQFSELTIKGDRGFWHKSPSEAEWEMLVNWLVGADMSGHKGVSLAY